MLNNLGLYFTAILWRLCLCAEFSGAISKNTQINNYTSAKVLSKKEALNAYYLHAQNFPLAFPLPPYHQPVLVDYNVLYNDENSYKKFVTDFHARRIIQQAVDTCFVDKTCDHYYRNVKANQRFTEIGWNVKSIWRTSIVTHPNLPDYIIKVATSLPCMSKFSSTLRVPFGQFIQQTIEQKGFDLLTVPKEGLAPILAKDLFARFDDTEAPYGFLVIAEKIDISFPIHQFRALSPDIQYRAAVQICSLIVLTFLDDPEIGSNIVYLPDRQKFAIIDTEPLRNQMNIVPPKFQYTDKKFQELLEYDKVAIAQESAEDDDASIDNAMDYSSMGYYFATKMYIQNVKPGPCLGLHVFLDSASKNHLHIWYHVAKTFTDHYKC